jgi:Domain of unknown function (DUF6919)
MEAGMKALKGWRDARTLADLGELTARWVEGKIPGHPCNGNAPTDPETHEIAAYLARCNRAGLVTTFSQPGRGHDAQGCAQRAALEALTTEAVARRIGALTLYTSLVVFLWPPGVSGGCQVPITVDEFHPFAWLGASSDDDDSEWLASGISASAERALCRAWRVQVIDPVWGRKRYLWREVLSVLSGHDNDVDRFHIKPAESLELDTDLML